MMNRRHFRAGVLAAFGLALGGLAVGCASGSADVKLTSFKDPYFPEPLSVKFHGAKYWYGPDKDLHIICRNERADAHGRTELREYLLVQMYWRPNPGRTFSDPTATNASIQYVVATAEGVASYRGAGYAYPNDPPADRATYALETGQMTIESTQGDVPEVLGPSRITATIDAPRDDNGAARWIREMEQIAERGGSARAK